MVLLFYLKGRVNMKEKRMMVSKSVALTQAMQGMKLTEYRIFLYALSKVNPFNVEKAKEEVYISLRDFRDMFPTKNRGIRNITKAIEEAENRSVTLPLNTVPPEPVMVQGPSSVSPSTTSPSTEPLLA